MRRRQVVGSGGGSTRRGASELGAGNAGGDPVPGELPDASPERPPPTIRSWSGAAWSFRGGLDPHSAVLAHLLAESVEAETSGVELTFRSLERTDVPRLCPHGRPIYLEISRDSLDDRFERT